MCIFFSRNGRQGNYKDTDFEAPNCATREELVGAALDILLDIENLPCFLCRQDENEDWTVMSFPEVVDKVVELLEEMVRDLPTKKNPGSGGEKTAPSSSSNKTHDTLQQQQNQQEHNGAQERAAAGVGGAKVGAAANASGGGGGGGAVVGAELFAGAVGDGGGAVVGAQERAAGGGSGAVEIHETLQQQQEQQVQQVRCSGD